MTAARIRALARAARAILAVFALVGASIAGEARASAIDQAVARLATDLDLERVPGFSPRSHLALAVEADDAGGETGRILLGLLRARLLDRATLIELEAAPEHPHEVRGPAGRDGPGEARARLDARREPAGRDGAGEARARLDARREPASRDGAGEARARLDARARAAGAEWLLALHIHREGAGLRISAELRAIDGGLWRPLPLAPVIAATAEVHTEAQVSAEPSPSLSPATSSAPRFSGSPVSIGAIEGRVLALRACPIGGREVLFVLTASTLSAYTLSGTTLGALGRLDLGAIPCASARARDPLGAIACGPLRDQVAFGSSDLAAGRVVLAEPSGTGLTLTFGEVLTGIPLGSPELGALIEGRTDGGRARFARTAILRAHGREEARELPSPVLDLAVEASLPAGARAFAVLEDYRVLRLSEDLASGTPVAKSGVGIAVVAGPVPALVTTASVAQMRDRVRLVPLGGEPHGESSFEIEGLAVASAVLHGSGLAVLTAGWRPALDRTDLHLVPVAHAIPGER